MTTGSDTARSAVDGALQADVASWFTPVALRSMVFPNDTQAARLPAEWLARGGRRWRPLLAVECLHKASLIHDDIEDADEVRYGQPTLHREYGIPVAINVGDLLVGEGYRLLAACEASEVIRAPNCVRQRG